MAAMAPGLSRQPLALALLALALAGASSDASPVVGMKPSPVLAQYSFDDRLVDTGPDTFAVFRNARGNVQLSTDFQVSGHRSVEIRDVVGDGNFPELQGYLPERRDGWLVIHFAILVADPREELNVSFAGPGWFHLGPNGHAIWLTTRDGWLHHTTGKTSSALALEPYTWYAVDVDYDVTRGRYDLRITSEGADEPAVSLKDQRNASDYPGSIVSLFSFVGSVWVDTSHVEYWLDDLWIGTSREAVLAPFVAYRAAGSCSWTGWTPASVELREAAAGHARGPASTPWSTPAGCNAEGAPRLPGWRRPGTRPLRRRIMPAPGASTSRLLDFRDLEKKVPLSPEALGRPSPPGHIPRVRRSIARKVYGNADPRD